MVSGLNEVSESIAQPLRVCAGPLERKHDHLRDNGITLAKLRQELAISTVVVLRRCNGGFDFLYQGPEIIRQAVD